MGSMLLIFERTRLFVFVEGQADLGANILNDALLRFLFWSKLISLSLEKVCDQRTCFETDVKCKIRKLLILSFLHKKFRLRVLKIPYYM